MWYLSPEGDLIIQWDNNASYIFRHDPCNHEGCNRCFEGVAAGTKSAVLGIKMKFIHELGSAERMIIGSGSGTEWTVYFEGGSFNVLFETAGNSIRPQEESLCLDENSAGKADVAILREQLMSIKSWKMEHWVACDCLHVLIDWGQISLPKFDMDLNAKVMTADDIQIGNTKVLRIEYMRDASESAPPSPLMSKPNVV